MPVYWISDDCEEHARQWLDEEYEIDHRKLDEEYVQKDWEYQTNINDQTSAASVSCSNEDWGMGNMVTRVWSLSPDSTAQLTSAHASLSHMHIQNSVYHIKPWQNKSGQLFVGMPHIKENTGSFGLSCFVRDLYNWIFQVEALERLQEYDKQVWFEHVTQYNYDQFNDASLKRRFENMALLGIAAMDETSLSEFNNIVSQMQG